MSKPKFTKGPWVARTHDGELKHAVIYLNGGGFDISNCPDCVANAHLIAAAPDMYDALASIENDGNQVPAWLWDKIQDTLAKARGEK